VKKEGKLGGFYVGDVKDHDTSYKLTRNEEERPKT
jgi:hypothetical protein